MLGEILVNGVTQGAAYALVGIGFVVIFRATGVMSFAQGFYSLLGALLFGTLIRSQVPLWPAVIASVALAAIAGAVTYLIVFFRLAAAKPFVISVATIGLGIALEEVAILIWGPGTIMFPAQFGFGNVGNISWLPVNAVDIFTIGAAIVVVALTFLGLQRTKTGLRMRAVADNVSLASLQGVNVVGIGTLAWAVAAGAAGVAGIAFVVGSQPDADSVFSLGLTAFPAILLGGLDSIAGCIIGGIVIGIIQTVVTIHLGPDWADPMAYLVLLAVLLVRPRGLFGTDRAVRV